MNFKTHKIKDYINLLRHLCSAVVLFAVTVDIVSVFAPIANADTFTVLNTNDSGAGSLRQAIIDANTNIATDTIEFDSSVSGVISLSSGLPQITDSLILDGTTADDAFSGPDITINGNGASSCINFNGGSENQVLGIAFTACDSGITVSSGVSGMAIGTESADSQNAFYSNNDYGIYLTGASNVNIENNIVYSNTIGIYADLSAQNISIGSAGYDYVNKIYSNDGNGIYIGSADNVDIQANYVGTSTGLDALGNSGNGVFVSEYASNVTIGSDAGSSGNIISANLENGIHIEADSCVIKNNIIGLSADGSLDMGNTQNGILIESGLNLIGGESSLSANVVSGNDENGISINSSVQNEVYSNIIGLSQDKSSAIANSESGIEISGSFAQIGYAGDFDKANFVSGNGTYGIHLNNSANANISSNYIGEYFVNSLHGVYISNTSASNKIGSESSSAGNQIDFNSAGLYNAINLAGDAGSFNEFRYNDFLTTLHDPVAITNPANESVDAPSILYSDSSYASGTATSGHAVDLYVDGLYVQTAIANDSGSWEKNAFFSGSELLAIATSVNSNSSSSSSYLTITADLSSPEAPSFSSLTGITNTPEYLMSGSKDPYSSIESNGTRIVPIDSSSEWEYSLTLNEGENIFEITSEDYSSNESDVSTYSVILDSIAPVLTSIEYDSSTREDSSILTGSSEIGSELYLNDELLGTTVDSLGNFSITLDLDLGANIFTLKAVDSAGNESNEEIIAIERRRSGGGGSSGGSSGSSSSDSSSSNAEDSSEEAPEEPVVAPEEPVIVPEEPVVVPEEPETTIEDQIASEQSLAGEKEDESSSNAKDDNRSKGGGGGKNNNSGNSNNSQLIGPQPVSNIAIEQLNYSTEIPENAVFDDSIIKTELVESIFALKLGENFDETLDSDGDGVTDKNEILASSNINLKDSDGDGADDFIEIYNLGTNPSKWDTDLDGQSDIQDKNPLVYDKPKINEYVLNDFVYQNKITQSISVNDSDLDGLSDEFELQRSMNPLEKDSDADGISDGDEVIFYDSNPEYINSKEQISSLHIANLKNEEVVASGKLTIIGRSAPNKFIKLMFFDANANDWNVVASGSSDDEGKYMILTPDLSDGKIQLILSSHDSESAKADDFSAPYALNVVSTNNVSAPVKSESSISDGEFTEDPVLNLQADSGKIIVITWQSKIIGQTLIADASGQINARPFAQLEPGEHKVTWTAVDPETLEKSESKQISFNIPNKAFIAGQIKKDQSPMQILYYGLTVIAAMFVISKLYAKHEKN